MPSWGIHRYSKLAVLQVLFIIALIDGPSFWIVTIGNGDLSGNEVGMTISILSLESLHAAPPPPAQYGGGGGMLSGLGGMVAQGMANAHPDAIDLGTCLEIIPEDQYDKSWRRRSI